MRAFSITKTLVSSASDSAIARMLHAWSDICSAVCSNPRHELPVQIGISPVVSKAIATGNGNRQVTVRPWSREPVAVGRHSISKPWPIELDDEPPIQMSQLRAWTLLRRARHDYRVACQVPVAWLLGMLRTDGQADGLLWPKVDYVLCGSTGSPVLAIHLIDGPGLENRQSRDEMVRIEAKLKLLTDAGIRVWRWSARSLPEVKLVERHLRTMARSMKPTEAKATVGQGRTSTSVPASGLMSRKTLSAPQVRSEPSNVFRPAREEPGGCVLQDSSSSGNGALRPSLPSNDVCSIRPDSFSLMHQALLELLASSDQPRRRLRHVFELERAIVRSGTRALSTLPVLALLKANRQLGKHAGAEGTSAAIAALRDQISEVIGARRLAMNEFKLDSTIPKTERKKSLEITEVGMSTFLELDRAWEEQVKRSITAASTVTPQIKVAEP